MILAAWMAVWAGGWAGGAAASCRLALVLALDVSGSVDDAEYALQMGGAAAALEDADVQAALLAVPGAPVALAVFEWSGAAFQREVVSWRSLSDAAAIVAVADRLRGQVRVAAPQATGLGAALVRGGRLLQGAPACARQVVDVSADGRNNDWPAPREGAVGAALAGATVNGLAVGGAVPLDELTAYFRAEVIRGPGAFVEEARDYAAYADAMRRKLLRELESPPMGAMPRWPDKGVALAGSPTELGRRGRAIPTRPDLR